MNESNGIILGIAILLILAGSFLTTKEVSTLKDRVLRLETTPTLISER